MKKLVAIALLSMFLFTSCNSESSLQKYYVEKSESPDFVVLDVAPSILNIDKAKLTVEQSQSLASFEKMNILAFKLNETNSVIYGEEKAKVAEILKGKEYNELMRFSNGDGSASVSYIGTDDKIKEFVLFASSDDNGFAVVRILGKDMTPNSVVDMMSIVQSSNLQVDQLKPIQDMFNKNL